MMDKNNPKSQDFIEKDNSLFSIVCDFLDTLIVILDKDGKIIYYNKACSDITGLSLNEVRGKYYWEVFCLPEERELYKFFFNMLKPDQFPLEVESQLQSNDGSLYTILCKYNIWQEQKGVIEYLILNGTDLTNQVNDKKALQELGEKYRAILHASPVSVISTDTEFNIKSWSSAAENLIGWPEKDVLNRNIFYFLLDSNESLKFYCENALSGVIKKDLELDCQRRNGTPIYLSISLAPTRDYQGKIDGIVMVAFDITQRKEAEEKIRYLSFHDHLTGLYNRYFLEEEMKRLDTIRQHPIGIIMADLNGLKLINDTFGHSAGDEMIKYASYILKKSCRKEDIISRWGGDEFVILLPKTTEDNLEKISRRIDENCKNATVKDIPISLSVGTAIKESQNKNLTEILHKAEDKMYNQKLTLSRDIKNTIINALLNKLEEKSFETKNHYNRMQQIAVKIGDRIGISQYELNKLKQLITLHDIGEINIPKEILSKKGPLTTNEWDMIKKHPVIGYRIARATEEFAHVAKEILAHHEHWNGNGYPMGLKGKDIPFLARITALADTCEVMNSERPYNPHFSREDIKAELKRCCGTQFDPELVKITLEILEEDLLEELD